MYKERSPFEERNTCYRGSDCSRQARLNDRVYEMAMTSWNFQHGVNPGQRSGNADEFRAVADLFNDEEWGLMVAETYSARHPRHSISVGPRPEET